MRLTRRLAAILTMMWPASKVYAPTYQPIRMVDARATGTAMTPPQSHQRGNDKDSIIAMLDLAADRYGIPRELLRRRAWAESKFQAHAVSRDRRCYGLLQLNRAFYPHAETMSVAQNIDAGAKFLAEKLRQCGGDWVCAERAYRSGRAQWHASR